jgi:hypothetical protein
MFAASTVHTGRRILAASAAAVVSGLVLLAAICGRALPSAEAQGLVSPAPTPMADPAALAPRAEQPPPKILVDPPSPSRWRGGSLSFSSGPRTCRSCRCSVPLRQPYRRGSGTST